MNGSAVCAILAGLTGLAASLGAADKPNWPVTHLNFDRSYASAEIAAKAVLIRAYILTVRTNVEWGGVIEICGRRFYYTEPVSTAEEFHVGYNIEIGEKCHVAAFYHTHIAAAVPEFSELDLRQANDWGLPSFLWPLAFPAPIAYYPGRTPMYDDPVYGPASYGEPW